MKIPGHNNRTMIEKTRRQSGQARTEGDEGKSASVSGPAARVQMSEGARAARGPEAPDMEKVERLRAAIANGELRIDASRIANRMLEEEL